MHYVLIATHSAEICPSSNGTTRKLMQESAPEIPAIADKIGVKIVAGPFVSREHITVSVVEAKNGEDLDQFIVDSRLAQWNSVRVLPAKTMQEGVAEIEQMPIVY
jgi:hypothetical protein